VQRQVKTEEGVKIYGPGYRDMDFHAWLHVWSQLANHVQDVPTHESERKPIEDATGGNGAPEQEVWHAMEILACAAPPRAAAAR